MNKAICDSSIWIAFFNETDSQHAKAVSVIRTLEEERIPIVMTNYIDLECISILLQKVSFHASSRWIAFRASTERIEHWCVDQEDHQNIVQLFLKKRNKHLSLVDISLLYFGLNGYCVYTFDEKLKKAVYS